MDLASVFRKFAAEGTGQLALKFADTTHLCKISIENGEAVYIKLGTLSPEETLAEIAGKELIEANFIKGFSPRKRLESPITAQLVGEESGDVSSNVSSETRHIVTSSIPGDVVLRLMNDYIDIVGPLGVVIVEKFIKTTGYVRGEAIDAAIYTALLEQLLIDIPESMREEFQSNHS
ncbi:hypothetical protein [uncultured Desulfuromonas sp.]|uniref:hypothetical protein n=1 Tax=uncultured Desulfuromonas sp. TaxID=181013 RepID=UPI002AAA6E8A|nr:hypothetical protein [uncultured Desulfuromonas sp.]